MNRKYYRLIMAAVGITAAAASCKMAEPEEIGTQITITASTEVETKTTLEDNSTQVYWQPGDQIKLFSGENSGRFVSTNTSEAITATFRGTLDFVFGVSEGGENVGTLLALYPYSASATSDGSTISTTLSGTQTGKAGSFAEGQFISVAKANGSFTMSFYNVLGGVRFSLKQEGIHTVTFRGNDDEILGGAITIGWGDDGYPTVTEAADTVKTLTLTAPDGGTFEVGEYYYITALPKLLSKGYTMTFTGDTKTGILTSSSPVTIKRAIFGSLTQADKNVEYQETGGDTPTENNIVFADQVAKYACVDKFDTDADGEISYEEAAAVTDVSGLFTDWNAVKSFDEFQYFTSVTTIPKSLFDGCTSLESVKIPSSVKTVGSCAFRNCSSIKSIEVPSDVTSIGIYAFYGCSSLETIDIDCKITAISNYTFRNCTSLTSVNVPSGVTSIGNYAFYGCTSLATVDMPSSVTSLGTYAFYGCTSLTTVSLSSNLKTIDTYAFQNCSALKSIALPSTLTTIGNYAFSGAGLNSVVIPDSVTSLGTYMFQNCSALTSAVLPSSLTSIPNYTFYRCTSLQTISFPANLEKIGNYVFYNCVFVNPDTQVSKIELPSTVTTIGDNNFNAVGNVIIPSTSTVTISAATFGTGVRIYVPASKVDLYKARTNWSNFADYIFPISDYSDQSVYEAVDLGLSVKWASCNIGAAMPTGYGEYYAWGETEVKSNYDWSTYKWMASGQSDWVYINKYQCKDGQTTACWYDSDGNFIGDGKTVLETADDVAAQKWGGKWRMPTDSEWTELRNTDNCTLTWTTQNGVNGYLVTSKKEGYTDRSIFLPAAGGRTGANLDNVGSYGRYWSSSLNTGLSYRAYYVYFSSGSVGRYVDYRYNGSSVRPVQE